MSNFLIFVPLLLAGFRVHAQGVLHGLDNYSQNSGSAALQGIDTVVSPDVVTETADNGADNTIVTSTVTTPASTSATSSVIVIGHVSQRANLALVIGLIVASLVLLIGAGIALWLVRRRQKQRHTAARATSQVRHHPRHKPLITAAAIFEADVRAAGDGLLGILQSAALRGALQASCAAA